MGYFELDKWPLKHMNDLRKKGRLSLHPEYQRGPHAWGDSQRYDLVDTVMREWPSGLIMLRVDKAKDKDGVVIETYDVVDGQQRLTTLFEYMDGSEGWALKAPAKYQHAGFLPYSQMTEAKQARVDEYRVAVALMKEYDVQDILDVYSRLQTGKPLTIGEKVKALRSPYKEYVKDLAGHRLFNLDRNHWRDQHWNVAAQFFKAAYMDDPLARVEFPELKSFLTDFHNADQPKAQKARDRANKVMGFECKTIEEAISQKKDLEAALSSARMLKWLFATLMRLVDSYALTGKQHLVGRGVIEYLAAKDKELAPEWTAYTKAGRTGRIDTFDVKVCLVPTYLNQRNNV